MLWFIVAVLLVLVATNQLFLGKQYIIVAANEKFANTTVGGNEIPDYDEEITNEFLELLHSFNKEKIERITTQINDKGLTAVFYDMDMLVLRFFSYDVILWHEVGVGAVNDRV